MVETQTEMADRHKWQKASVNCRHFPGKVPGVLFPSPRHEFKDLRICVRRSFLFLNGIPYMSVARTPVAPARERGLVP